MVNQNTNKLYFEEMENEESCYTGQDQCISENSQSLLEMGCIELVDPYEQESLRIASDYDYYIEMKDEDAKLYANKEDPHWSSEWLYREIPAPTTKRLYMKITHCEMDPNLMLGVLPSFLPMSCNNMGPRNAFGQNMAK